MSEALLELGRVLRSHDIPDQFQRSYEKGGVRSLYQWQYDCINDSGAMNGKNLVYCAPTGGGKTMVAELLMLKTLITRRKKAIFVLPYVSLVKEKEKYFKKLVHQYNCSLDKRDRIRVKGFYGDVGALSCVKFDILVCTIEKSNLVVNTLVRQGYAHKIGCLVVDEMHTLGDKDRGYHLEILVSKIKLLIFRHRMYISEHTACHNSSDMIVDGGGFYDVQVQMVALSATVGNIAALAEWFEAYLYQTNFRPVQLTEFLVAGNEVLDCAGIAKRQLIENSSEHSGTSKAKAISSSKNMAQTVNSGNDGLTILVNEGLRNGQQILVFCSSRNACQAVCKHLSAAIVASSCTGSDSSDRSPMRHQGSRLSGEALILGRLAIADNIACGVATASGGVGGDGVVTTLCGGLRVGVAFHHAGLTDSHREAVESAYKNGYISVLVCTSTLAAGVNLPAGRVIINGMRIGYSDKLNVVQYRQMCGRAGRAGLSTSAAESFLLVRPMEKGDALALMSAPYPHVVSQMTPNTAEGNKGFLRASLELCSLGLCDSLTTFKLYIQQTLFYTDFVHEQDSLGGINNDILPDGTMQALQFLLNARILERTVPETMTVDILNQGNNTDDLFFGLTRLGKAIIACNMNPDDSIVYYEDLLRAQDSVNLETNLHIAYLCAPLYHSLLPNFGKICDIFTSSESTSPVKRVMTAIGLEAGVLMRWVHSPPSSNMVHGVADTLRLLKSRTGVVLDVDSSSVNTAQKPALSRMKESDVSMMCRCKRLWAAQLIVDIINTQDTAVVSKIYNIPIGDIEQLLKNAVLLSGKMVEFATQIGWTSLAHILKNFSPLLRAVDQTDPTPEMVDLLAIPGMNAKTAQLLINSKMFSSCASIAASAAEDIARCLRLSMAFDVTPSFVNSAPQAKNEKPKLTANHNKSEVALPRIKSAAPNASATSQNTHSTCNNMSTPRVTRSTSSTQSSHQSGSGERRNTSGGSIAKRLRSSGSVDDGDIGTTDSGRKRRRRSAGTLLNAFHDSAASTGVSPIVSRTEFKNNTGCPDKEVTATEENEIAMRPVNERQNLLNKNLIGFANRLIENANNILEQRESEECDGVLSTGGPSPDPLEAVEEEDENWSEEASVSSASDSSSEGSLGSLSEVALELIGIGDGLGQTAENETELEEDESVPPWLRRAMHKDRNSKYRNAKAADVTEVDRDTHATVSIDPPNDDSDHVLVTISTAETPVPKQDSNHIAGDNDWLYISEDALCCMMNSAERRYSLKQKQLIKSNHKNRASMSGKKSSPNLAASDYPPGEVGIEIVSDWLNISDDALCRMMNSAERRYSLKQKQTLLLSKRKTTSSTDKRAARTESPDASVPETAFVDIIAASSTLHDDDGIVQSPVSPARKPSQENTSDAEFDFAALNLEIPPDFFDDGSSGDEDTTDDIVDSIAAVESDTDIVKSSEFESFLSQYTPSKIRSAKKYMSYEYAELQDNCSDQGGRNVGRIPSIQPGLCSDVLSIGNECSVRRSESITADLVDLSCASELQCQRFVDMALTRKCFSFELVYRTIPSTQQLHPPAAYPAPKLRCKKNGTRDWNSFICHRPTGSTGVKTKSKFSTTLPSVVSGISLCFDLSAGYFLPLSCPLPLLHGIREPRENTAAQSSVFVDLPTKAMVLISRMVGVGRYVTKCTSLRAAYEEAVQPFSLRRKKSFMQATPLSDNTVDDCPNSLFFVNKGWNEACRRAIQEEWRRGGSFEWILLNKIFSCEQTTKVALYAKDQLVALRERDVLTNGFLEDPVIAAQLLEIEESALKWKDIRPSDNSQLPLCSKLYTPSRHFHDKKEATLKTIRNMYMMKMLEAELREKQLLDLFLFVEMPLCKCVSEMEHAGMPLVSFLFVNLKQDLSDRCKIIDSYFKQVEGKDFNLSSEKYIAMWKKRLGREILSDVLSNRAGAGVGGSTMETVFGKERNRPLNTNEQSPEVIAEVSDRMMLHPLVKLLSEWRSHSSTLISCSNILSSVTSSGAQKNEQNGSSSSSSRIHGSINTIGTATGRMTVVSPPLQQMAHECIYRPCRRQSIHHEIVLAAAACGGDTDFGVDILNHEWSNSAQWVRVVPLCGVESTVPFRFEIGKLIEICYVTIDQPIPEDQDMSQSDVASMATLLSQWAEHGHIYSASDANTIRMVKVSVSNLSAPDMIGGTPGNTSISKRGTHFVPADKVFRLNAPIEPHADELQEIFNHSGHNEDTADSKKSGDFTGQCIVSPRSGFVAASGSVLMSVDYSQIELRILAHFCEDPTLLKAFREESIDVFKGICCRWKKKDVALVTAAERDAVKQLCYAIIYGAGAGRISAVANCSQAEAKFLYQDFLKKHPGITKFITKVKKESRKCGFVTTILGRRRHLKGINSDNKTVYARAERQAVNTICQGSAADLIKLAMVNIHSRLQSVFHGKEGAFRCRRSLPGGGLYKRTDSIRMILQIHDELLFELPEAYLAEVAAIIIDCMEKALQLLVPLKVKVNVGKNWSSLFPYPPDEEND